MSKITKVAILIVVLAAAGFGGYEYFQKNKPKPVNELETMKTNMVADPQINAKDLTDVQRQKFLDDFKVSKQAVIDSNFDNLQSINGLALAKQHLGDLKGAETAWLYANVIRPKNSLSFSNLAALYHYDLKQYDKAEQNYLISLANDPQDIPTIRNFFELYYYAMKDNAKAEALLLKSIADNPNEADLYSLTGRFYQEIGQLQKALEYYQKHLDLHPGNQNVIREMDKIREQLKTKT